MGDNSSLGKLGQLAAEKLLRQKGYEILAANYRRGRCEIDLIARRDGYTVFVEVKTRSNSRYGAPREAVTPAKQRHIIRAAWAYVAEFALTGDMRFDVVEVFVQNEKIWARHLENAFQDRF